MSSAICSRRASDPPPPQMRTARNGRPNCGRRHRLDHSHHRRPNRSFHLTRPKDSPTPNHIARRRTTPLQRQQSEARPIV
ncbi:uncharacterized protein PHACADRAFT_251096 [Phanerochaete carnosa HHB-10118-sp]|uniref:Uncharacterized protein n=1 Tax=Phanerochaete carnosa (strain HHB-10118-sp) TaxID=650164 RepID=K5V4B0_PHACS|nr:uncharacterized protein PHACADRAFT_251096 [Phanerochaete carnosa HHB-10118-sp]EKM57436.1 hypothetical protein PHACADRAFT_251096 [Phanerochaete carnosa HHB-10118-sp]